MKSGENRQTWCVYMHTFPNQKRYIGITCMQPTRRWGKDGRGYKGQSVIWNAIQEFGWENIRHEIMFYYLTENEAKQKEEELIMEYNTTSEECGYNVLGVDHKDYEKAKTNTRAKLYDAITRQQLSMLLGLYNLNSKHQITAITVDDLVKHINCSQSYTTHWRSIEKLYTEGYVALGLKYGKFYSYFITDKGIDVLKEYSLI